MLAVKAGTRLRVEVEADGIGQSFAQPSNGADKPVTVVIVARIEAGIAEIQIGEHISRLKPDGGNAVVHRGFKIAVVDQRRVARPCAVHGVIVIAKLFGDAGIDAQALVKARL